MTELHTDTTDTTTDATPILGRRLRRIAAGAALALVVLVPAQLAGAVQHGPGDIADRPDVTIPGPGDLTDPDDGPGIPPGPGDLTNPEDPGLPPDPGDLADRPSVPTQPGGTAAPAAADAVVVQPSFTG